jgi:putative holliday junction resolvase
LYIRTVGADGENTATKDPNRYCSKCRKILRYSYFVEGRRDGRILALDVGKRRIGIAISDGLNITAQGLPTLERTTVREDLRHLAELTVAREVSLLLIGDPLHMSGDQSRQAQYIRDFAARLSEKSGVPVRFWDERLTTVQAQRVLKESGISIEKRARAVDQLAAVILLESYLDALSAGSK